MDQDSNKAPASSGSSTNPLVLLVTLLAGGLLIHQLPLFDSRPTAPEPKAYSYIAANRIDARLWQDPIEAVARGIKDNPRPATGGPGAKDVDSAEKSAAPLRDWLRDNSNPQPLVLGVVVPGGSYSGYSEWRRKARYAVLSGLAAKGFTPTDPEHLEYFSLDTKLRALIDPDGKGKSIEARFVAYEWLDAAAEGTARFGDSSAAVPAAGYKSGERSVVIIWLDEDMFWQKPIQGFDALFNFLFDRAPKPNADSSGGDKKNPKGNEPKPRVTILGPGDSTVLKHMVAEAANVRRQVDLSFYDYASTATDAELLKGAGRISSPPKLAKFFQERNLAVFRTIGDDHSLACALRDELATRGISVPVLSPSSTHDRPLPDDFAAPAVVLISEWDSTYGRALSGITRDVIVGASDCDSSPTVVGMRLTPDLVLNMHWLRTYTYLRGLDGRLPERAGDSKSTSGTTADASATSKASGSNATSDDKAIERAQGQSQLDYLRRLALKLHEMDENARHLDQLGIRAIGVFGSDVYDKLIVLQALRPAFPNVLFFTTDLDARLLHPLELDWTRNLLVASSFGLDLAPGVQSGVPPFRDVYETSLFLATLIALNNAPQEPCVAGASPLVSVTRPPPCVVGQEWIDGWRKQPRLFEVGRHGPFDLSRNPIPQGATIRACAADTLGDCATVYPAAHALVPPSNRLGWRLTIGALVLGIVALALVGGAGTRVHAWAAKRHPTWSTTKKPQVIGMAMVGLVLFAAFAYALPNMFEALAMYLTQNGEGVPMTLLDGVSIWPTELIRLFALFLALFFTWYGWRKLEHNLKYVSDEMKWGTKRKELEREVNKDYKAWGRWQRYLHVFSYQLDSEVTARIRVDEFPAEGVPAQAAINPKTGLRPEAEAFWRSYIYQNRVSARLSRIATAIGLYFVFVGAVVALFGFPEVAIRGARAAAIDKRLVIVAVLAMLFLTFFVVDATLLCRQFVVAISTRRRAAKGALKGALRDEFDAITAYTRWPADTLQHFAKKLKLDRRYVDQWVTIHVIGLRTDAVSRLIYFPYIIISLVIVARSSIFDNWSMPISLIIILGTSVAIVTMSAIMLRTAAEYARRKAIWRLTNEQVRLNSGGDVQQRTSKQLDLLIQQIRRYDTGSFASYLDQPLLRAIMLPLGSFGGVGMLQYLAIFNL
jgi:hypothetical protein